MSSDSSTTTATPSGTLATSITPASLDPTRPSAPLIESAPTPTPLSPDSLHKLASSLPKYLIAGGIILAILVVLASLSFWWKRRRRRNRFGLDEDESEDEDEETARALREWERCLRKARTRGTASADSSSLSVDMCGVEENRVGRRSRTPLRGSYDVPSPRAPSPFPLSFPSPVLLSDGSRGMVSPHHLSVQIEDAKASTAGLDRDLEAEEKGRENVKKVVSISSLSIGGAV